MPTFVLGSGNQSFDSSTEPTWNPVGSQVFGGSGSDEILATGSSLILDGGSGNDEVTASGDLNTLNGGSGHDIIVSTGNFSILDGGSGNDELSATGRFNTLSGGSGNDDISSTSSGGFFEVGPGNTLIGGSGVDSFSLDNRSDLIATNDTNGIVSEGDRIAGVMDVITDYKSSENIDLPGDAGYTEIGTVALDGFSSSHQHLLIEAKQFAVLDGNLVSNGQFDVNASGDDKLVVYDSSTNDEPFLQGAVVLEDYSGAVRIQDILFA